MRKTIFLAIFSFLVFPSLPVFAQGSLERDTFQQLKQSTGGALLQLPSLIKKSVEILLARMSAGVTRVEKINGRIFTRIEKIKFLLKQEKSSLKTTKLDTQSAKIAKLIDQLKSEKAKTEDLAATLLASSDLKKDYQAFRRQVVVTNGLLKEILKLEKSLVDDLKQYKVASATPTVPVQQIP